MIEMVPKGVENSTRTIGIQKNRDHPDYNIILRFGDLRRLAVTQTPVEDHRLSLL